MPSPVLPRKAAACAGKWRFVSALCLYCSKFPGGIQPAARAEFEKSDSPGKSAVGIGVFRTIAALGYHRGAQPMASPLAITSPMAVMAASAAFAALLFPQAQRDRHRQSARTMETNFLCWIHTLFLVRRQKNGIRPAGMICPEGILPGIISSIPSFLEKNR